MHEHCGPLKEKMKVNEAIVKKFDETLKVREREVRDAQVVFPSKLHAREMDLLDKTIQSHQQKLVEVGEEQKNLCQTYEQMVSDKDKQEETIRNFQSQITVSHLALHGVLYLSY